MVATSDDPAWLLARFREPSARSVHRDQLKVQAVLGLLDTRRLAEDAQAVGLATPRTWFPAAERARHSQPFSRYHCTVSFTPSSRPTRGRQPSAFCASSEVATKCCSSMSAFSGVSITARPVTCPKAFTP